MTFIASVVARNGVAVIADSLVTTEQPVLEYSDYIEFLVKKGKESNNKKKQIRVNGDEIIPLFQRKPHHTKDYEEKLFKYDKFTAITTAGNAIINKKRIAQIIENIIKKNDELAGYKNKKIETKVKDFCELLESEVKNHLKDSISIHPSTFIVSNYNSKKNLVRVFRVLINPSSQKNLEDTDHEFVEFRKAEEYEKVVCDGQNKLSEKILLGDLPALFLFIPKIVKRVASDFNIDEKQITHDYITELRNDRSVLPESLFADAKITKLSELSLQQAVDLAWLLMRIEIDFQKYTEDIPTVGGVIKLAKIDKNGFNFIAGEEIVKPQNF